MAGVKKQQGPGLVIAIYSELGLGLVVFVRYVYESCNCVKSLLIFGPCTSTWGPFPLCFQKKVSSRQNVNIALELWRREKEIVSL